MNDHPMEQETTRRSGSGRERGSAMIMALGVLTVLAVLALLVMSVAISGKRTAYSDFSGSTSFYSADAASEAGVNWLKHQYSPAALVDSLNHVYVADDYTTIGATGRYRYDITYTGKQYRPGWSVEYKDYEYGVAASGQSTPTAASSVQLSASRLYREGY